MSDNGKNSYSPTRSESCSDFEWEDNLNEKDIMNYPDDKIKTGFFQAYEMSKEIIDLNEDKANSRRTWIGYRDMFAKEWSKREDHLGPVPHTQKVNDCSLSQEQSVFSKRKMEEKQETSDKNSTSSVQGDETTQKSKRLKQDSSNVDSCSDPMSYGWDDGE